MNANMAYIPDHCAALNSALLTLSGSTIDRAENKLCFDIKERVRVPLHRKLTLTIKEAAEHSNIGINKTDSMLKQPDCPFDLYIGSRKSAKRRELEDCIRNGLII